MTAEAVAGHSRCSGLRTSISTGLPALAAAIVGVDSRRARCTLEEAGDVFNQVESPLL